MFEYWIKFQNLEKNKSKENAKKISVCTLKTFILNICPKFLTISFDPQSHHMNVMNIWSLDKTMNIWAKNVDIGFWVLLSIYLI